MVRTIQHPAGAGCQVKLKMRNFYAWLIICGLTSEILCTDAINGKQIEDHITSTTSSNDVSGAQTFNEGKFIDAHSNQHSDDNYLHRFLRAVPRIKTPIEPEDKSKNEQKLDYVLKIPLSVLRQLELYRLLMLQEREENRKYYKRSSVIPIPRYGRSGNKNEYDIEDTDNAYQYVISEEDNFPEVYLNELVKEDYDNGVSETRNSRSMLLLSAPKSEDTTKEKPSQTFVLPYPRPGRSKNHMKAQEIEKYQLILPYPRPGRSIYQNDLSKMISLKDNDEKYVLPTARFGRSTLDSIFGKENDVGIVDDGISNVKYSPSFLKMNKGKNSGSTEDEESSFFVIPYPRPGKRSMFKLKNRNQEQKNSEKEITDYILPYPRPGKKSTFISGKQNDIESTDFQNLINSYLRSEETDENFSDVPYIHDSSDDFNINGNIDISNVMENKNNAMMPEEEFESMFVTRNKKSENKFILPYLRTGRNFNNVVPYPRPGRSASYGNVALPLFSDDTYADSNKIQISKIGLRNSKDILRYKRSASVVPYPRLGRSNSVVPYPRLGRSDSVVPYPRLGRSSVGSYPSLERSNLLYNAAVPYVELGYSPSIIPYSFNNRLKRRSSVLPYPRLGRSDSILPYPRPGRSESVLPYPRLGRSESVVPYPRLGRAESVVPYPRPGRAESIVPYPRPGRAESLVPYPRPGRSDSVVPYPRPGRSDSVVPYPRPGRSNSVVPYPRPGRSNSVVPYPRPGRSNIEKTELSNKYGKQEKWLLPNIRPGRSNLKQNNQNTVGNIVSNLTPEKSVDEHNSRYTDATSNELSEVDSASRYDRASDGQGYVLPHPRIGRSLSHARKKRESSDTDTVIPYPRLGRSQKETVPVKTSPEYQNSVHKLNKHMLTNLEDSVYLLPYPRPGRYLE